MLAGRTQPGYERYTIVLLLSKQKHEINTIIMRSPHGYIDHGIFITRTAQTCLEQ